MKCFFLIEMELACGEKRPGDARTASAAGSTHQSL